MVWLHSRGCEDGIHCNDNDRPPEDDKWAVSCMDLGYASGELTCRRPGDCFMDLSGCAE